MKEKPLVVYMLMSTKAGKEREVVKEARRFPGVTEAKVVYGEYDVIVRIELNDFSVLDETVTLIRRIPGITKTATLISAA
ncbi:TPA: Lrp/AsnC family transcriptional regulator [Candidatus Bathyarchaeota archaeon]|nr:Lrp/AsnC family transcriptional regulator [Candidatus Bathyarchaeota archaeon]